MYFRIGSASSRHGDLRVKVFVSLIGEVFFARGRERRRLEQYVFRSVFLWVSTASGFTERLVVQCFGRLGWRVVAVMGRAKAIK